LDDVEASIGEGGENVVKGVCCSRQLDDVVFGAKGAGPVALGCGGRVHVGKEEMAARTEDPSALIGECGEAIDVTKDERGEDEFDGTVPDGKRGGVSEMECRGRGQLHAGAFKHRRRTVDAHQRSWRERLKTAEPAAGTTAHVEDVSVGNFRQECRESTFFESKQRVELVIIVLRPAVEDSTRRDCTWRRHKLSRLGLRRAMN
jgi:hypothetical protein